MSNVSLIDGHIDELKITNDEIIKALECCIAKENCEEFSCENCPLEKYSDCKIIMLQNAINLIKQSKK